MSKRRKPDIAQQSEPIQMGMPIEGTHLCRRYQGGKQITPIYVGSTTHLSEVIEMAEAEAEANGYNKVKVGEETFVRLAGEWYVMC